MTKKSLRVVLLVMIVFVLNANNIFADELTQEEFSRYKNSLSPDQAKVLRLFYGFDGEEKYDNNWEGIAEKMSKPLEKIYESYADALIKINEIKAGPNEKTDLESEFRKYWGILSANEQEVAELYFDLLKKGSAKPLPEIKKSSRFKKNAYKHFATSLNKIKRLPNELKIEVEFLNFIHKYEKYFSDLQIKLAMAYLTRDANWQKPKLAHLDDVFEVSVNQSSNIWREINIITKEIPDTLLEEERNRKLMEDHFDKFSERQTDILKLYFWGRKDGQPLSYKDIANELKEKYDISKETVGRDLRSAFEIIEYSPKDIHEELLRAIKDFPERFTNDQIRAIESGDSSSGPYRNATIKVRSLPEKLQEEFSLAEKFEKYELNLNENQNAIRKLRLNKKGGVVRSWAEVAFIMNQEEYRRASNKSWDKYSVFKVFQYAKERVKYLAESGALPMRERAEYQKFPVEYGKERPFEGFQFRSRPRGRK